MKIIKIASYTILVTALAFTSCKKKTTDDTVPVAVTETDETTAFAQHAEDIKISEINVDMGMDDAENAMSPSSLGNKSAGTTDYPTICGSVDTSAITSAKTITITYNGNSCDGLKSRAGSIVIKLLHGTKWKDQGAVISLTYINFQVTILSTSRANTLNGTLYVTNVSGGIVNRIGLLSNPTTIVRRVRAINMNITFDDNTVRSWTIARLRIWNGSAGLVSNLSVAGDTTLNGTTNTEVWGTNRAGIVFTSVDNLPIKVIASCGLLLPVSGKKTFNINGRVSTITFGTDASGNVSLSACPAYYLLAWTSLDNTAQSYIGLY